MMFDKGVRRTLRALLCLVFVCLTAACGGGGGGGSGASPAAVPTAWGYFGDSTAEGTYFAKDGSGARLAQPSVAALRAAGFMVTDYSRGAATTREVLSQPSLYGDDLPPLPFPKPITSYFRVMPETGALIRYGTADAAGKGETPEVFAANLKTIVAAALDAGKTVYLVGLDGRVPGWPGFDEAIRNTAAAMGVRFIDISRVPVVLIDNVHPDQATSAAITAVIADALRSGQ